LLPRVAKLIDDLEHENFRVPVLRYQHRVLQNEDRNSGNSVVKEYDDEDFIDGREQYDYDATSLRFSAELSNNEVIKLVKINRLLKQALGGKAISLSQMRSVLTPLQLADYESSLVRIEHHEEAMFADGVPDVLQKYNRMLRAADLQANKKAKNPQARSATAARVEHLYETALEYLEEIWTQAEQGRSSVSVGELAAWLDREVDFYKGMERSIGPDAESMPRVRGSRSRHALDSGLPKLSQRVKRRWCALNSLMVAACEIAFVLQASSPAANIATEHQERMRKMLESVHPEKD
jgi:hypothetical protein